MPFLNAKGRELLVKGIALAKAEQLTKTDQIYR
jgi:hypothetical protein